VVAALFLTGAFLTAAFLAGLIGPLR
jgi:hypothetical protein